MRFQIQSPAERLLAKRKKLLERVIRAIRHRFALRLELERLG
jgi:hypothetical protein